VRGGRLSFSGRPGRRVPVGPRVDARGMAGSDDGWDRMIGFLAEVHNLRRHTRDTTGARDAVPRTTPPPRARHDPAGLGSAPTPLGHPGRLTAANWNCQHAAQAMPPSSGPRHFDTRYAPQTPHVASTISEVHASTVHRTKTRLTCTSNPARHHDTLHSTVAMKLESEYGRELSYVVVP
jgi:hypothetical protein